MPYILAVAFVVILFSVAGIAGGMGKGISGVLYGLFSNFATYFVAIFMLFHSLMWYYDSNRGICARRVICSLITVFCVAALQHLITLSAGNAEASTFSVKVLYSLGASGIGGGVIGGVIGMLLHNLLSAVGGIITVCIILFFMMLQMFNITPASLLKNRISRKKAEKAEKRAAEAEKTE